MSLKVIVTGGAGYIGAALVEQLGLLPAVAEITVYDNLSVNKTDFFFHAKLNKEKVRFVEGDILETRKLNKLVKEADVVVHLAALDTHESDNNTIHQLEQVNHWGTAELSYAVENSEVQKFIFLSSAEVYGYGDEVKTEDSETDATTPYAASKLRAEAHIVRLAQKMTTYVFRSGTVLGYGNVKSTKGVANTLFYDALVKQKVSIHGDGKQLRPFLSLNYLVPILTKAVVGSQFTSGIYNVSQANRQVLDILEELKKLLPETEFIFTNHHLHLPSLLIETQYSNVLPKENLNVGHEFEDILKHVKI